MKEICVRNIENVGQGNFMTKTELNEWIKKAEFIDSTEEFVDDSGNFEGYRIYENDGRYYRLEFCNNYPSPKWGPKGYIKDVYELEIVKQIKRQIVITEYEPINDEDSV